MKDVYNESASFGKALKQCIHQVIIILGEQSPNQAQYPPLPFQHEQEVFVGGGNVMLPLN